MGIISVDYVQVKKSLTRLEGICEEMFSDIKEIALYVRTLDIFWDGDANGMFITRINEDLACIDATIYSLCDCAKVLHTAIMAYQELERLTDRVIGDMKI